MTHGFVTINIKHQPNNEVNDKQEQNKDECLSSIENTIVEENIKQQSISINEEKTLSLEK